MAKTIDILTGELYRLMKEVGDERGLEVIDTDDSRRMVIDEEMDLIFYAEPIEVLTSDGLQKRFYGEIYYNSRPVKYLDETASKYLLEKLKGTLNYNKE